jgi:hypothetical protein
MNSRRVLLRVPNLVSKPNSESKFGFEVKYLDLNLDLNLMSNNSQSLYLVL